MFKSILTIVIILNHISVIYCFHQNNEGSLLKHLFNRSVDTRPVINASSPIKLKFGIQLVQIISVDEPTNMITIKVWVRQSWTNELINWSPEEWGNVDRLNVNSELVWKPDVVLYNNAGEKFSGGSEKYKTLVTIHPNGKHFWFSPALFTSTCKINVKYFPFDLQICSLKFGSWAFDSTKVDVEDNGLPTLTEKYINSSEWDILRVEKKVNNIKYSCCKNLYVDLTMTITMKRRPLYFIFNVISPCIVLVLMVLFSFLLPPDSGERLSLNITVLLALAVFLQFISESLPKTSDSTPILSIFYMTLMAESALALVSTILILAIHHKGEEKGAISPSAWMVRSVLNIIPSEVGYQTRGKLQWDSQKKDASNKIVGMDDIYMKFINNNSTRDNFQYKSNKIWKQVQRNPVKKWTKHENLLLASYQEILSEVNFVYESMNEKEQFEEVEHEWKMLGKTLDRILFFAFFLIFLLSSLGTLMQVYRETEF